MATELMMQRAASGLVPVDQMGMEAMGKIAFGKNVKCVVTQPRNIKFHALFFALLNLVYINQDMYATLEGLLDAVKIAIGHCDELVTLDGKLCMIPRSISWAEMDDLSFRDFFDRAVNIIIEKILPHTSKKDLEQEVFNLLKEPGPEQLMRTA